MFSNIALKDFFFAIYHQKLQRYWLVPFLLTSLAAVSLRVLSLCRLPSSPASVLFLGNVAVLLLAAGGLAARARSLVLLR
ncbi:unnamed protein product [Urochloa humidicola]